MAKFNLDIRARPLGEYHKPEVLLTSQINHRFVLNVNIFLGDMPPDLSSQQGPSALAFGCLQSPQLNTSFSTTSPVEPPFPKDQP